MDNQYLCSGLRKFKVHISLSLVCLIFTGLIWQTAIISHFYMFQDEIAAENCENLDKPELNCHGKCHLKKQLAIEKSKDQPTEQTFASTPSVYFGFFSSTSSFKSPISKNTLASFFVIEGEPTPIIIPHFHPPELIS